MKEWSQSVVKGAEVLVEFAEERQYAFGVSSNYLGILRFDLTHSDTRHTTRVTHHYKDGFELFVCFAFAFDFRGRYQSDFHIRELEGVLPSSLYKVSGFIDEANRDKNALYNLEPFIRKFCFFSDEMFRGDWMTEFEKLHKKPPVVE